MPVAQMFHCVQENGLPKPDCPPFEAVEETGISPRCPNCGCLQNIPMEYLEAPAAAHAPTPAPKAPKHERQDPALIVPAAENPPITMDDIEVPAEPAPVAEAPKPRRKRKSTSEKAAAKKG